MSRDVTTRWNSTYDMLSFVVKYRKAIELLTSERKNDLRQYELMEAEWVIASELCDTLKVSYSVIILCGTVQPYSSRCQCFTDPQRCYNILLACYS
jgi:hypothetical protein